MSALRIGRAFLVGVAALAVVGAFAWKGWRLIESRWLDASGARVELVVLHWSGEGGPEENAIVERSLRDFEAAHPGVRVRRINPGDAGSFATKLQTMLASGDPPDVFYVPFEKVPHWSSIGLLKPLDALVAGDEASGVDGAVTLDAFFPAVVDAFRFDGERAGRGALYGVPKDFTTVGFYYNKDLFRRAGVPLPHDEWTWEDFIDAARRIGQIEDARGRPCIGSEFVTWPAMVRAYLRSEGLDVRGESFDDLRTSDPQVQAVLDRLRSWRHDEERTLTSGTSRLTAGAAGFVDGRLGMTGPFGRWVVPEYRRIRDFEWDFAPLPRGVGKPPSNIVLTVAWGISSQTRHTEKAWALVRWLTSPRIQAEQSKLGLAIPAIMSVAESDAFIDPTAAPANDRAFVSAARFAEPLDWPADPKFDSLLGNRFDAALKDGTMPVAAAAADFERLWAMELASPVSALATLEAPKMPWRALMVVALLGVALVVTAAVFLLRGGSLTAGARREERAGFLLAAPWIVGFVVFMLGPVVMSLLLSLTRWSGISTIDEARWVALGNYAQLLQDERLATSVRVTLIYVLLAVPVGQVLALAAAFLMSRSLRGVPFFRAAWYLPSVLAGVGVAVLWRWIFDTEHGLLNRGLEPLLGLIGVRAPDWFGQDAGWLGAPAFALMSFWMLGASMMIYVAGIQNVPEELHEAAEIDGVPPLRRTLTVTLPMLGPVILFNTLMSLIGSFQVFTQAFVMTGGEPRDLTRFYVLYLYNQGFEYFEMGYASALAWVLLVVVLIITAVLLRTSRSFVHTEVRT
ncbi:MAG: extracellular solute-binding protein [Phycisphaeraceae bacterium]|nr:extracellular solute-binding protein [Phycisphaeraceae bacterium]